MRKFKPGDRVIYRCDHDGCTGRPDLDGHAGTVIGVDGTRIPYTVEFDDAFPDAAEDIRFGGRKGHCWHCTESHLTEEDNGSKKTIKSKEKEMERYEWTPERDEVVVTMLKAGDDYADICDRLGIKEEQLKNRLYKLRKADPTLPGKNSRAGGKVTEVDEEGEQFFNETPTAALKDAVAEKEAAVNRCRKLETMVETDEHVEALVANITDRLHELTEDRNRMADMVLKLVERFVVAG